MTLCVPSSFVMRSLSGAVGPDPVELGLEGRFLGRREIDVAARVVDEGRILGRVVPAASPDRPVALRDRVLPNAVGAVTVEMRVAVLLERDDPRLPAVRELDLLLVHEGGVAVAQDQGRSPAGAVESPDVEFRLGPVHRLDDDGGAVGEPVHAEEVLVGGSGRLHPGRLRSGEIRDPESYDRVRPAGSRVALANLARHGRSEVGERRDVDPGVVGPQEGDGFRVGRPPVAGVAAVEDLFPVHPGKRAVEDRVASVGGEPGLRLRARGP